MQDTFTRPVTGGSVPRRDGSSRATWLQGGRWRCRTGDGNVRRHGGQAELPTGTFVRLLYSGRLLGRPLARVVLWN